MIDPITIYLHMAICTAVALHVDSPNGPKSIAIILGAAWPATLTTILLIALIKKAE